MTSVSLVVLASGGLPRLNLFVKSVLNQSVKPNELIIADTGETEGVKDLIKEIRSLCDIKVIYCAHKSARTTSIKLKNLAVVKSASDYIIMVDGNSVLHKRFIQDHLLFAKSGHYVNGQQVILKPSIVSKAISSPKPFKPNALSASKLSIGNINNSFAMRLRSKPTQESLLANPAALFNLGFYRADAISVNGFNSEFKVDDGLVLREFCLRLMNAGLKNINVNHGATTYTLPLTSTTFFKMLKARTSSMYITSRVLFDTSLMHNLKWCKSGINEFMNVSNLIPTDMTTVVYLSSKAKRRRRAA